LVSPKPVKSSVKTTNKTMAQQKGLGDTIAEFTKVTGLDKIAERVAKAAGKEDCGCNKRRETLNKKFPYKQ
jgi:hypothetical protein